MTARLDSPPTILRALCLAVALAAIALIATAVIGQDDGAASETTPPPAAPEASGPSPGGGGAEAPARPESPPPSPSEGADGAPADGGNAEAAAPSDGAETTSQPEPQPTEDATDALEGLISDRAEEPLETDPTQEELSQAAEAEADTPASTEGQERTDAAMEPARQLSPEEEKAVHRAEAHARSQQLGAERRDTLQSAFEGLTAPIEPDAEDTRTPEEIREAQERTLVRMAQIARVELAACRRELAERRTELNDVTSAQELLEERMDWEPAAVRRGRKLASEARLAVTTLTDNSMEYEQRFNSLLAEHGEAVWGSDGPS